MSTDDFDVFAPLRPTSTAVRRQRGHRLNPIIREDLIWRAQLLREHDTPNCEIAAALGVSTATVTAWIGKQPSHLDGRRTAAPSARTQSKRSSKWHTGVGPQIDFDYHSLDACEVVDEPPCRSAETIPQDMRAILDAAAEATASASCDLTEHGVVTHATESDEAVWYAEPEPAVPPVPSDFWFRLYAGYVRNAWDIGDEMHYSDVRSGKRALVFGRRR